MNARKGRWSVLALALLAIGGCGGSTSQHRDAGSAGSRGSRSPSSTAARSNPGTASRAGSAGTTGTVSTAATGTAGAGTDSVPVAKVTFAAPGGESQARFVASADAICRSFRARARAIGATATTLAAQETELGHLVTATEQAVKALTDLSPPTADAAGQRRFAEMTVASVVAFAEAQSRNRSTSEAVGSEVEARDLADSSRSSHDAAAAQAAARTLGLRVCGSPGSAWL